MAIISTSSTYWKEGDMALKMQGVHVKTNSTNTTIDYSKHLESKPVVVATSIEYKIAGSEWAGAPSETKTLHPGVFGTKMSITIEGGRTLNLGNYESAKIGVSITVPCDPETLNEAYEFGTNWVSEKIEEGVSAAKGES